MRYVGLTAMAMILLASSAFAQYTPAKNAAQNPAVKSTMQNNSSAPVAGANSFTMSQAKSQLEAKGYTHVKNLKKDQSGVWRGMATKDNVAGPVSVDYQGNVN